MLMFVSAEAELVLLILTGHQSPPVIHLKYVASRIHLFSVLKFYLVS